MKKTSVKKVIAKKTVTQKKVNKKKEVKQFNDEQKSIIEKWISRQRYLYKKNLLSKDSIRELEAIPNWQWKNRSRFDSFANLVKNYADRNGHLNISLNYEENGIKIAKWIYAQKKRYEKGVLDSYEIDTLESIPNWTWEIRKMRHHVSFEDMLVIARAYLT